MEGRADLDIWAQYPCLRPPPPFQDPDLCTTCVTTLQTLLRVDSSALTEPQERHNRGKVAASRALEIPHHTTIDSLQRSAEQECPLCVEVLTKFNEAGFDLLTPLFISPVIEELDTSIAPIKFGFRYFEVGNLCTFKVEHKSGNAPTVAGRTVQKRLDPGLAREWVWQCEQNHPRCRKSELGVLPTRVIEILWSRSFEPQLRLVDGAGRKADYAALSHCWGDPKVSPPTTTTEANLQAHKIKLNFFDLPLTFQDAVIAVRDLRFQFFGIDSICIIQDSDEDRTHECARMDEIYRDASLTLAVADVCCSNCGFREPCCQMVCQLLKKGIKQCREHPSPKSEPRGFNINLFKGIGHMETNLRIVPATRFAGGDKSMFFHADLWMNKTFHPSILDERAWTFQERLLSSKVLRLCDGEIGLECETARFFEDMRYPVTELNPRFDSLYGGLAIPKNILKIDYTFYDMWGQLVYEYSKRRLTYGGDRLLALAGIASFLAKRTGDRFLGGMWEKDLARGLAWYRLPTASNESSHPVYLFPPKSPLPSWSWASCAVPLCAPQVGYNFRSLIELCAAHGGPEHDSQVLEMEAFVQPLNRSRLRQYSGQRERIALDTPNFNYNTDTQPQLVITMALLLDNPTADKINWLDDIEQDAEISCMLLGEYEQNHNTKSCLWRALLLQHDLGEPTTYRRLGVMKNGFGSDYEHSTKVLEWLKVGGQRAVRLI